MFSRDVCLIGAGGGVNLPWIYVHSAIYYLFGTKVFHRSMVDWRKGWGLSALVSVHTSTCETSSV